MQEIQVLPDDRLGCGAWRFVALIIRRVGILLFVLIFLLYDRFTSNFRTLQSNRTPDQNRNQEELDRVYLQIVDLIEFARVLAIPIKDILHDHEVYLLIL